MRNAPPLNCLLLLTAVALLVAETGAWGQRRPRPQRRSAYVVSSQAEADSVTISYPDSVNLAAFVDYVAQSLETKIIYGDEVRSQTVVFRPGEVEVPKEQLLDLLRSMLKMQDLALVEGDVSGWLRIIHAGDMQRHVSEIRHAAPEGLSTTSNRIVTQVLKIKSPDMSRVVQHARSFLSSPKASVIEVPDKHMLIVTDYESAISKAIEIIQLLDAQPDVATVVAVPIRHRDAETVAERVARVYGEKAKYEGAEITALTIDPDPRTNTVLLIGAEDAIDAATGLIEEFDAPSQADQVTRVYSPQHMTASRLRQLIEGIMLSRDDRLSDTYLFIDEATNRLYATATAELHGEITDLLAREDVRGVEPSRPMRIYRPQNRLARDLIATLSELLPNVSVSSVQTKELTPADGKPRVPPGPNRPPGPVGPGQTPPMPPAQEPIVTVTQHDPRVHRIEGSDFVLSYDDHTNAIIAIGPREFHAKLQTLLAELDRRQPQVLVEMTLVAVTFNDSFSLAIELTNTEKHGDYLSLLFSAFGLSDIDATTGARTFNPGAGFNGIILGPDEAPFLMRAIAAHGNSRVITTPRIIAADNTTATIGSVEEAPFTSINASDTVATTSFAGFESAGTTLTVSPRIAQGDHLSLDYTLSFSNFTGGGSIGVPPPRTTNSFTGSVEIPDGHTIVVGGLVTENEVDSVTEVPILGRIPVIGVLFQSSDRVRTKARIFAFIRATILRDDRFADLKLISETEMERAKLRNRDFPDSEYVWMR